jgi:hypothetical protein
VQPGLDWQHARAERGGGGAPIHLCAKVGLFKAGLVMHMIFFASGVMKEGGGGVV